MPHAPLNVVGSMLRQGQEAIESALEQHAVACIFIHWDPQAGSLMKLLYASQLHDKSAQTTQID